MSDRSLGAIILVLCLFGAILYVGWLFWPASSDNVLFYFNGIRWALLLPTLIAVLAVIFIGMWIGWTMTTTPPPISIEDEFEEQTEEVKE